MSKKAISNFKKPIFILYPTYIYIQQVNDHFKRLLEENICSNEDSITNALKSTDKNDFSAFEVQKQLFLEQVQSLEQMLAQILIQGFTECTNWEQIKKVFMNKFPNTTVGAYFSY